MEEVRENKIKQIWRERTTLTETTGLRELSGGFTCIANTDHRRTVERKDTVDNKRGNAEEAKRGLDRGKGDRIEGLRPVEEEDMQRVLSPFIDFKNTTHNMYRLVSGALGSKAELGRANLFVKVIRETFL